MPVNEFVKVKHSFPRDTYVTWRNASKPRQGPECEQMHVTRSQFRYAPKQCVADEEQFKSDKLAALSERDVNKFWITVINMCLGMIWDTTEAS